MEPPPANMASPLVRARTRSQAQAASVGQGQDVKEGDENPPVGGGSSSLGASSSPRPLSGELWPGPQQSLSMPQPSPPSPPLSPSASSPSRSPSPAGSSHHGRRRTPHNPPPITSVSGRRDRGGDRGSGDYMESQHYFQKNWGRAKIIQLTETNYDAWELSLRNVFYANAWDELMDAIDGGYRASVRVEMRKAAWGCVTTSLSYEMSTLTSSISLGNVEELVRLVFNHHYRNSPSTRGALKDKLHSLKLEDYKSFEAYVAEMKNILRRLSSVGYEVGDEDRVYYLLKGLPSDYDALKQTIRCCQSREGTTFEIAIADIRSFCQDNPKVFGSGVATTKRSDTVMVQQDSSNRFRKSKGVCKYYAKGQTCPYKPCKYKHKKATTSSKESETSKDSKGSSQVPTCTYCEKGKHPVAKCWKKKRESKGSEKDSVAKVSDLDESEEEAWVTVDHVSEDVFTVQAESHDPLWLIDGGSTCHVTPNRDGMFDVRAVNITIQVGGGRSYKCTQVGNIRVRTDRGRTFVLKDVRLCSEFQRSILSEAPFIDKGCAVLKVDKELTVVSKAAVKVILFWQGFATRGSCFRSRWSEF